MEGSMPVGAEFALLASPPPSAKRTSRSVLHSLTLDNPMKTMSLSASGRRPNVGTAGETTGWEAGAG